MTLSVSDRQKSLAQTLGGAVALNVWFIIDAGFAGCRSSALPTRWNAGRSSVLCDETDGWPAEDFDPVRGDLTGDLDADLDRGDRECERETSRLVSAASVMALPMRYSASRMRRCMFSRSRSWRRCSRSSSQLRNCRVPTGT